MRCKNCGWNNPEDQTKCEKCKTSLSGLSENVPVEGGAPKKTIEGCPQCGYPLKRAEKSCPQCGKVFENEMPVVEKAIPIIENEIPTPAVVKAPPAAKKICPFCKSTVPETALFCSNCGASLTKERRSPEGTVVPFLDYEPVKAPECSLTLLIRDNESGNQSLLRFSGNVIKLNRSNTEPGNQTITSKVQAELTYENDKWYIQDKSTLKTTYIYTGEKTELKQGDIIVLGNRLFEFNFTTDNPSS